MSKKKRVFVGYELSDELKLKVKKWQEEHKFFPVRFTPLANLHVTLVPPWYTEDVEEVISQLKTQEKLITPFSVLFETITFGPENRRPWLLWARGETTDKFLALRSQLVQILERENERKRPVLHTTIARFNQKQFAKFIDKEFFEHIQWKETITSFSLIESRLRRTGAVYETLAKVRL